MNNLSDDFIAIDTNIFEHLLNPSENTDCHIDKLLRKLCTDKIKLLVDKKKRITNEYANRFAEKIQQIKDHPKKRFLFLYWIKPNNHHSIQVRFGDELMTKIKQIIVGNNDKKTIDRIFVYVALKKRRILITNDRGSIIDEKTLGDGERRCKLLDIPKKDELKKEANILTSLEAHDKIAPHS